MIEHDRSPITPAPKGANGKCRLYDDIAPQLM